MINNPNIPPVKRPYHKMNRKQKRLHLRWCKKHGIVDMDVIRYHKKQNNED